MYIPVVSRLYNVYCVLPCMLLLTLPTLPAALDFLFTHDFYTTSMNRVKCYQGAVFVLVYNSVKKLMYRLSQVQNIMHCNVMS